MTFETATAIIERHLNSESTDYDEVEIDLFGGEPFVNFPLMREICEYTWARRWKKPYLFFATTNGTLVHGAIRDWVYANRHHFFLGLSLDGTPQMHNINRSNSFEKIDIDFFRECWPNQAVKMTLSRETLPDLAVGVIFIHSLGFEIHNNPAYGIDWSSPENVAIFEREVGKLIEYYLEHPEIKPCSLLDMPLAYIGYTPKKWCGVGVEMAVYGHDGVRYPCHSFLPVSVGDEKSAASQSLDFTDTEKLVDPKCVNCLLYNICATCYGSNYAVSGDIAIRDPHICIFTRMRAAANSYFLAQRILRGQAIPDHSSQDRLVDAILKLQADDIYPALCGGPDRPYLPMSASVIQ